MTPQPVRHRPADRRVTAGLTILLAAALSACIPLSLPRLGDPGFYVEYRNQTGRDLTLYIVGERDGLPDAGHFRADAISGSVWQYPREDSDARQVTVFATDASGVLVFCSSFTRASIRELNYRIDIIDGTNDCR